MQAPAASRDEFITVENLREISKIVGSLDILVYLQPDTNLYLKFPAKPIGDFKYTVTMDRLLPSDDGITEDVKRSSYPYVPREDNPVELDKYFGY